MVSEPRGRRTRALSPRRVRPLKRPAVRAVCCAAASKAASREGAVKQGGTTEAFSRSRPWRHCRARTGAFFLSRPGAQCMQVRRGTRRRACILPVRGPMYRRPGQSRARFARRQTAFCTRRLFRPPCPACRFRMMAAPPGQPESAGCLRFRSNERGILL